MRSIVFIYILVASAIVFNVVSADCSRLTDEEAQDLIERVAKLMLVVLQRAGMSCTAYVDALRALEQSAKE